MLLIFYITVCLVVFFLEKRQKPPKIDPILIKRYFWSQDFVSTNKKVATLQGRVKRPICKKSGNCELPIRLGRDLSGKEHIIDLAKLPHLLIAGASGQGKSNFLNSLITSYSKLPVSVLKLKLVDVKIVEFEQYKNLSNAQVYNDVDSCIDMLERQKDSMKGRLELLSLSGAKNVLEFNTKFSKRLPFIVIIIDEFASLALDRKRKDKFLDLVSYFSRVGRAAGFHLVLATQRPDQKAVTGEIKANFGGIIAFKVANSLNSRIILDQSGAELLQQKGRCLFKRGADITEIQTPKFID